MLQLGSFAASHTQHRLDLSCTIFAKVIALVTSPYLPPKGVGFYYFPKISVSHPARVISKQLSQASSRMKMKSCNFSPERVETWNPQSSEESPGKLGSYNFY
jgi:hypothetical protein